MLIKRNDTMTFGTRPVKKMTGLVLSGLFICTSAIAPAAFAGDAKMVEKVVKVKLHLSDMKDESGTQNTYAKLKRRAKSFCRVQSPTLQYFGESLQDCAADLVDQFITSANVDTLTQYHLSQQDIQKTSTKLTLNKTKAGL